MGWKKISNKKIKTGIVDSNGKMIYVGSMINYPKRIRVGSYIKSNGQYNQVKKGYTELVKVKVVGFGYIVKQNWKKELLEIQFLNVENCYNDVFRLYRADRTSIVK